jgi:hypothetical protein
MQSATPADHRNEVEANLPWSDDVLQAASKETNACSRQRTSRRQPGESISLTCDRRHLGAGRLRRERATVSSSCGRPGARTGGLTLPRCGAFGSRRPLAVRDRQERVNRMDVLDALVALLAEVELRTRDAWGREGEPEQIVSVAGEAARRQVESLHRHLKRSRETSESQIEHTMSPSYSAEAKRRLGSVSQGEQEETKGDSVD